MKSGLYVKLFGTPAIFLDGQEIFFSFSKINALLYYLLIQEKVDREEIASLLWENKTTQTAKKNLRNTIYQANKFLGADYIISPNRNLLALNPDLTIHCDVGQFLKNPDDDLSLYQGPFLSNFYIKDSETFDFWIDKKRAFLEQIYIKACHQKIEHGLSQDDMEETEQHILKLIEIDEFEEHNYFLLMKLYQENQRPSKVTEVYYKLANLLDKELGISPSLEIQQLYDEVIAKDRNDQKMKQFLRSNVQLFGRSSEIRQLEAIFSDIVEKQDVRGLILKGGSGVGKRTLIREVLANQTQDFQIVTTECFQNEHDYPLRVWQVLLSGLGDLVIHNQLLTASQWQKAIDKQFEHALATPDIASNHQVLNQLADFTVDLMQQVASKKPLVILIEDCHWMDMVSLTVLHLLINRLKDSPLALILTKHLATHSELEKVLGAFSLKKEVSQIELNPYDDNQSRAFVEQLLDGQRLPEETWSELLYFAQGRPFYLSQYAELLANKQPWSPLTPAIETKLDLRLADLKSREEDIMSFMACFGEPIEPIFLGKLLGLATSQLLAICDSLCQQRLLKEVVTTNQILLSFEQPLLQIYCRQRLSAGKRRLIHDRIAQGLELLLASQSRKSDCLMSIAKHYQAAKQVLKALSFQLEHLSLNLQFQHELFPLQTQESLEIHHSPVDLATLHDTFASMSEKLKSLEEQYGGEQEFQALVNSFHFLEGRFNIRRGHYEEGVRHIRQLIDSAKLLGQTELVLNGYRQIINYCIQVENIEEMKFYTELALDEAVSTNNHEAIAVHLRLKGLYHLMTGDLQVAKRLLQQSVDCFSLTPKLKTLYAIQIAAALDYLAEIEQMTGNIKKAIFLQEEAIALTDDKPTETSSSIFYISLGISYYFLGQFDQAQAVFLKAQESTRSQSYPWKAVQLDVYLALIDRQKGLFQEAIRLITEREKLMSCYSNPRDKGLLYYLMCLLKYDLLTGSIEQEELTRLLDQTFTYYHDIAKNNLNPYRDIKLLTHLDVLNKTLP